MTIPPKYPPVPSAEEVNKALFGDNPTDERCQASPRPWRINPEWVVSEQIGGHEPTPSPILDANGEAVLDSSEWLTVKAADIALIVAAVNQLKEASA